MTWEWVILIDSILIAIILLTALSNWKEVRLAREGKLKFGERRANEVYDKPY